jgi:acetyl esterase/lipase
MTIRIALVLLVAVVSTPCMAQLSQTQPSKTPKTVPTPDNARAFRDVEYARFGDKSLLLDVYVPRGAQGPLPTVVWIHGGGWSSGSKDFCRTIGLVARGYVVASINYRFAQDAPFPAQIEDCKAAIRFLRANAAKYQIDKDRIGVSGASAGGHLVALLGTSGGVKDLEGKVGGNLEQSSKVQCVVDFCGPTDLMLFTNRGDGAAAVAGLLGGSIEKAKDLAHAANPVTYVTKDDPPFLIVHGDKDTLVPIEHSQLLDKALKDAGVEVKLHVAQGAGHNLGGQQIDRMVGAFFDNHLKTKPATQPASGPASRPSRD